MGIGRCQAPNPTKPMGQLPFIVFQILISLKGNLTCYSNTHNFSKHLKQSTWHNHPQTQHLSIMAYRHISQRAKISQDRSRSTCYSIQTSRSRDLGKHINYIIFINQTKCMFIALCMTQLTYLIVSQHLYINACSWYSHNLKP